MQEDFGLLFRFLKKGRIHKKGGVYKPVRRRRVIYTIVDNKDLESITVKNTC